MSQLKLYRPGTGAWPGWDPKADPTLSTARLQVTELLPDSTNVGASDGFEFIELYNATSEPIDFADYTVNYLYRSMSTSNSNEVLWPAQPADVVIEPGKTLVFWITNGPNDDLGVDASNASSAPPSSSVRTSSRFRRLAWPTVGPRHRDPHNTGLQRHPRVLQHGHNR